MNDDPQHSCRPFDAERSGFVIGEGGGALVLETEENALARGATIYAELAGWANNNDAYHVIKPNPDGISSIKCMKKALKQAGLSPQGIDYINAHGTGTKLGDGAELNALGQLFGGKSESGQSSETWEVLEGSTGGAAGIPAEPRTSADPGISAAQGTQVAPGQKPPADQGGNPPRHQLDKRSHRPHDGGRWHHRIHRLYPGDPGRNRPTYIESGAM